MGDGAISGQFPSGNGSSSPSHSTLVEPFLPACESCIPILPSLSRCTNSTIRRHAATWSGRYIPAQPGEIRPSRLTSVISVITSPAPPIARLPRWTRCQSLGRPSSARYWHIEETTIRLGSTRSRSLYAVNSGGGQASIGRLRPLCFAAFSANHRSTWLTSFGSRTLRFSCVMRRLRVSRLKANWSGSVS